ncbi:MAG: glycosyltransferase [Runella zeae]
MIKKSVQSPAKNLPSDRRTSVFMANEYALTDVSLPEILFITSYPPRECGIATYSQDLIKALNNKFNHSFKINICAIEPENEQIRYPSEVKFILHSDPTRSLTGLATTINLNPNIKVVLVQHEFGFFQKREKKFQEFLETLNKPVIVSFHTVLPKPSELLQKQVQQIASVAESIVVMTHSSAKLLIEDYSVPENKITVIAHGTHLVAHSDTQLLKEKYQVAGRKILSTFGLLSSGKSIETTLRALPEIVKVNPDVLFLIIGKTHPSVVKQEGEKYHEMLASMVVELKLQAHVKFINYFLPLPDLLEYLQLTDVYLFTSKDPNQAVSGTFSYAISCGCPIVSTPIPHAREVIHSDAGIIFDFENSEQLARAVVSLLGNEELRKNISSHGLHKMASTAWENVAIAHAILFEFIAKDQISLHYKKPNVNVDYIKKLTTDFGMIQFSKINQPDIDSGYTLDDNARAMVAMCQHFEHTLDSEDTKYINIYLNFIQHCLQTEGDFLNYVDENYAFTAQNHLTNLADSNGRAIWALGYLISMSALLPPALAAKATSIMDRALVNIHEIHSPRAMSFIIKGIYYRNLKAASPYNQALIIQLTNRLVQMYKHESNPEWQWFESYLTYANSTLPEAMLCAWLATGNKAYKEIAKSSFDFLLSKIFREKGINVISNKSWFQKGDILPIVPIGGEQPIDVAYTILALGKFYEVFGEVDYLVKMRSSFNWFLGENHLHQIIYNPCTGGCYDGLEENYVNLNQGAESTVSYLMARLTVEKYIHNSLQKKTLVLPNASQVSHKVAS